VTMMTPVPDAPPAAPARPRTAPPSHAEERLGVNDTIALWMTTKVGSMWAVYLALVIIVGWIALASLGPLHTADPYPFPFLLFLGNVVQLLLVFVILVGQGVLARATDKRVVQTYDHAEAILRDVGQLHDHLLEQDRVLNQGMTLVESAPHPWIAARKTVRPRRVQDHYVGRNGQIAAFITRRVSTMWAFYVAAVFQFGWMAFAYVGLIRFDPYPFPFLLFLSSVLQLVFMFIILVGQDVLGQAGETRAQQTLLDTEAVLHECQRLQQHLLQQDTLIVGICAYVTEHTPSHTPSTEV